MAVLGDETTAAQESVMDGKGAFGFPSPSECKTWITGLPDLNGLGHAQANRDTGLQLAMILAKRLPTGFGLCWAWPRLHERMPSPGRHWVKRMGLKALDAQMLRLWDSVLGKPVTDTLPLYGDITANKSVKVVDLRTMHTSAMIEYFQQKQNGTYGRMHVLSSVDTKNHCPTRFFWQKLYTTSRGESIGSEKADPAFYNVIWNLPSENMANSSLSPLPTAQQAPASSVPNPIPYLQTIAPNFWNATQSKWVCDWHGKPLRVSVHIRRGDTGPPRQHGYGYFYNVSKVLFDTIADFDPFIAYNTYWFAFSSAFGGERPRVKEHIRDTLSFTERAWLRVDKCGSKQCSMPTPRVFYGMTDADFLIADKSRFSHLAGLLSTHAVKIMSPYRYATDCDDSWVATTNEGTYQDSEILREAVRRKLGCRLRSQD